MEEDFFSRAESRQKARKGGANRALIGIGAAAFLLGAALTGYVGWQAGYIDFGDDADRIGTGVSEAVAVVPTPTASSSEAAEVVEAAAEAAEAVEEVERQQGGLDSRLAALEQRINRLDLQSQAAAGNAARAEGLLIAFATRRSVERGDQLGYIGEQLRLRFGDAQPNAVQTIIESSRDPITLDQLLARLEGLQTELVRAPSTETTWQTIGRELSSLFVVRREDTPSPQPERRLERARLFLESGRIISAVSEVEALPGSDDAEAAQWIEDARRYARMQQALEQIESAAVLEPRRLRDGEGNPVEQPSPADSATGN